MANYRYIAKTINGQLHNGHLQANSEEEAYQKIKALGFYAMCLTEVKSKIRTKPLNSKHLAEFARQLSTMLSSGIPVVQALSIMEQREGNRGLKRIYRNIYQELVCGIVLSETLEEQNGIFPPLLVNMVRAGETSGQLPKAIGDTADYYEKDSSLQRKVVSALLYPAFLSVMTICAVITIFTVILPSFFDLFESIENLPVSTRFLIQLSKGMTNHGVQFLILMIGIVMIGMYLMQNPHIKRLSDRLKLKIPLIGRLMRTIYTARFALTLSSLYSNGVMLVSAIKTAASIIGNSYIETQFNKVLEDICNGISLSVTIAQVDGFDPKLSTSIYIGEEAGKLNVMLDHMAKNFNDEAEEATKRLITLMEPIMIVVMAVVIGFIMLSVMLPIYEYYQSIG